MRLLAPIVLIVSMLMLYVPFNPSMPAASLDPSWALGMNELAARHAVFGRDVVFTFGPLAAVYTTYFHPATDAMVMATSALLAVAVIGCWALILSGRSPWSWLGVSLTCWVCINSRDALLFAVPLLASLATAFWALDQEADAKASPVKVWRFNVASGLLLLAWGAVGVLPLIKGTMLVMALALTVFTAAFLITLHRPGMAVFVLLVPPGVSVAVWLALGQTLEAWPRYLGSMSEIIQGYTEAMAYGLGTPRSFIQVILYAWLAWMLVRRAVLFGLQRSRLTAVFFFLITAASLFLSFKSAFVRHDEGHVIIAMSVALILLCVAWVRLALPQTGRWKWLLLAALLWFAAMSGFRGWSVVRHLPQWWGGQQASLGALMDRLVRPSVIPDAFRAGYARIREQHPMPQLTGTVDVYSTNHAVALAHGLPWRPRPVLQSYSAYTPALARMNREHLLGPDAPDWIWFTVEPIDGRLASQEDGASWPVLLRDYEPMQQAQGGVILKRRLQAGTSDPDPGAVLLQQRVAMGERVELPRDAGPMTLSVDIHRNLLGRLLQTFFKARSLALEVELVSGETRRWRVVSGMLVEPVMLSPLVENTDEFAMLYGDASLLSDKQVRAVRLVEADRGPSHWGRDLELTIRRASSLGQQVAASSRAVPVLSPEPLGALPVPQPGNCKGHIDAINASTQVGKYVSRAPLLRGRGWALVRAVVAGSPRPRPFLLLQGENASWKMPLVPEPRPDVAAHLGQGSPVDSGWSVLGDLRSVPGSFTLSVAYEDAGVIRTCPDLTLVLQRP